MSGCSLVIDCTMSGMLQRASCWDDMQGIGHKGIAHACRQELRVRLEVLSMPRAQAWILSSVQQVRILTGDTLAPALSGDD